MSCHVMSCHKDGRRLHFDRKSETPTLRSQVFALVSRMLSQAPKHAEDNITMKNASGLSVLDFAMVTNNARIAAFLVELFYIYEKDILCRDDNGNTLLHLMARKGDVTVPTLHTLLSLRYRDPTKVQQRVFLSNVKNGKKEMPIHIAAMSKKCPHNVVQLLAVDMHECLSTPTVDGSLPIHLACQYSSDPALLAALLYYNR